MTAVSSTKAYKLGFKFSVGVSSY